MRHSQNWTPDFNVSMGKVTWATPNGRKANEYLSEGISASHRLVLVEAIAVIQFAEADRQQEKSQ
jgi:pyruvate-formate lyase